MSEVTGYNPLVVVVDIETLGKEVNATIASIGAVIINIFTGEIHDRFYLRCNIEHQERRAVDVDTFAFWRDQKTACPDAYNEIFSKTLHRVHLKIALDMLNDFIIDHIPERPQVFGNGPEFDNAILVHAMKQENVVPAWDYGSNQSMRTVVFMGRQLLNYDPKYSLDFKGTKHHALHDAEHEAQYLHLIFKRFCDVYSCLEITS